MNIKFLNIVLIFLVCLSSIGLAQNKLPREYVQPEELVSFNSNIDLAIALDVLSEYAIQFAQKPIYDPQKRTGPIGIDIRSIPWKKALGLILSRRGLWYIEKPRFFEVVSASEVDANLTGQSSIQLDADVDLKPNSREVKIETIFFEGNRNKLREIGLDWSSFYRGKVNIDAKQAGALEIAGETFSFDLTVPRNIIGVDIELLLKAFDSKKFGKVLAQPQVVVTEGKEGTIQVGQDFSIKERDFAGNIIDRFYSTGTILNVTPYIIQNKGPNGENQDPIIFLKIHVERSTAHPDVVSTIINKSQANSFLQLYDGEETLIAGLYSTEKNKLRKGIPILKDLPWWFFGFPYIFGYNRIETAEKELVIIIKASLLKNVYERQKLSKSDVMNLKQSMVRHFDMQLKDRAPEQQQQVVLNTQKKIQSSNSQVMAHNVSTFNDKKKSHPDKKSDKKVKSQKAKNSFNLGKITRMKKDLTLIQWARDCDPKKITGRKFPVLRKDKTKNKYNYIGLIQILGTKGNFSVGKKVKNNDKIKSGDLLLIRN